ncbi:MAG TPA: FtsQ-type POTRA domain-containing protein [Longimicrobiales bacterium]
MRTALRRIGLMAAVALLLVGGAVFAPLALRALGMFRVQRVELVGGRHLTAAAAARAAGITPSTNVFDDAAVWAERLRANPLVADVRIRRRLPGTLVLHVAEAVPIAFARTPELRPIGTNGRILPVDPSADALDLPVLAVRTRVSGSGRAVDRETLEIIGFLADAGRSEPGLIGWISEIGMHGDAIRLVLRTASAAEVLVPARPAAARLRELHITLGELAAAAPAAAGAARADEPDLSRVKRIDVRFHDQIVVSLHKGKS